MHEVQIGFPQDEHRTRVLRPGWLTHFSSRSVIVERLPGRSTMIRLVRLRSAVWIAVLLVLSACPGRDDRRVGSSSPSPQGSPQVSPPPPGEACPSQTGGSDSFVHLVDVRVGTHDTFDRITFEFRTTPEGKKMPKYELAAASPPFSEDASGEPIAVDGSKFARIIFHGATGYDLEQQAPTYSGPKELKPGFEVLVEAQETGDFEATLSWVLGLSRDSCWEVAQLVDPLRLVIDLPH